MSLGNHVSMIEKLKLLRKLWGEYTTDTITVDFDVEENDKLSYLIFYYRLRYVCSRYECRIMKTQKGIHVYIKLPYSVGFWQMIALRAWLLDDPARIDFDIMRYYSKAYNMINTLFTYKYDLENRYDYMESVLEFK